MRFSCYLVALLGIGGLHGFLSVDDLEEELEHRDFNKAILEMLHINKLSTPQQAKPHPYMKQVYESLDTQVRELSAADGTLVQSFRSFEGMHHFNENSNIKCKALKQCNFGYYKCAYI